MKNYGMTEYQINKAREKLEFNKDFMSSNGVQIDNKMIPYADFVQNSYTNSDRYVAELQHRAWSVYEYAKNRDLVNVFFTLTLPSKWHPMKQKSKKDKTMIFNKKFAGRKKILIKTKDKNNYEFFNAVATPVLPFKEHLFDLDFSTTIDKYTPRNASKELSKMLKRFFDDRAYKNIEKDDRCYFRVTEPHSDGTPHIHMSLFVPKDKRDKIVKSLVRLFPAPLGKVETEINSPVAYLMKYVLKTLDDLRDDSSKTTNLTLWYLYHGISRFYTSRTFVSLEVYRRLNGMYTLAELTDSFHNHDVRVYIDTTTKKIVLIENEFGNLYVPKPVNWSEKIDFADRLSEDKSSIELDSGFESIYKDVSPESLEFIINNEQYMTYNFQLNKLFDGNKKLNDLGIEPIPLNSILMKATKKPYQMTYFELHEYFNTLDIDTVDDKHYINTRNLMIDKGMIEGERLKLTAIDDISSELMGEVF